MLEQFDVSMPTPPGNSDSEAESGDDTNWLDAMRMELDRYRDENDETIVTLHSIYDFSERRLSVQFPENNHVRAKIRQLLRELRTVEKSSSSMIGERTV